MSEMGKDKKLFEEFPPVSTQEWEDKIHTDLKGNDYERSLVWRTNEGFNVRPYYRREDLENVNYLDVLPKEYPYTRGNKKDNNWYIRQEIIENDTAKANARAVELMGKGVESFGFVLDSKKEYSEADVATLLKGLPLDKVEVNFVAGYAAFDLVKGLRALIKADGVDAAAVKGSVVFDPVMCLAKTGKFCSTQPFADAAEMIKLTEDMPGFKALAIRGDIFENAGANKTQELAFALSVANEYMDKLTEAGVSADVVAQNLKFHFGTGSNYFMELAKVRVARMLWAQIAKQYEVKEEASVVAHIHAETSQWNKTIYDPYVNMLRTQTEAMSSVLGGVDSFTVHGYNQSFSQPTEFSDRIARNQQILLKEESHFGKVADPAAGSYYIEKLTDSLADSAWKLFLEVEEKGGIVEALKAGFVQEQVNAMAQKRDMDIANRKEILLGVNQFPNFTEKAEIELADEVLNRPTIEAGEVTPLIPYRGAMAFEALRYKTDVYSKDNKCPMVFMLTIGNLNMRKARAQFSSNFFAVAGFDVMEGKGYSTVEEGIKDAEANKADIIVICSSDDEYAEFAPQVKQQAGDKTVVVAGFPKAIMDDLKAAGLEHFIHVKVNVLETLTMFQKALGI